MVIFLARFVGLVLLSTSAIAQEAMRAELRLKAEVIVSGDVVRFDHLIEGIGARGEMPAFRAPSPGMRGTIRAARVVEAAREIGIPDLDAGALQSVTIYRPARMISREEMHAAIMRQLSDRMPGGEAEIVLDEAIAARAVDARRVGEIKVGSLSGDGRSGRFEARLLLPDGQDGGEAWIVAGSIVETREVAVPVSDLERGDAIEAKNLILVKRPANLVGSDVQAQLRDLVGMVPRRALRAGEFIRSADIAKPIWVEKNQIINVVFEQNGISLAMRGRAQQSGAEGDQIKVQNPQSKRIVEGIVTAPGKVSVAPQAPQPERLAQTLPPAGTSRLAR